MASDSTGVGVVGCGGFGLFALQQFAQLDGVVLVAMAATHREAAQAAARRFGMAHLETVEELVRRPDVQLVYIATPPFLHYEQAIAALKAGKHVICEKPLAITAQQAREMVSLADERRLLLVANLMQRYNPLFDKVQQLIESQILGDVLHGFFENYASDENLPAGHWFWDSEKSGGIFIEHGVHFFDMAEGWFGPGHVESAHAVARCDSSNGPPGIVDQVQCTVRYGRVLFNFYHGFHQTGRMDRQELRIVFELGDLRLFEWVPTRAALHAAVDETRTRQLCELFPGYKLDVNCGYGGKDRQCQSRGQPRDVAQTIDFTWEERRGKLQVYSQLLRYLFADQLAWIRDPSHRRIVTAENGLNSLLTAVRASELAGIATDGTVHA